jgi:pseudouridine-5'-monophosphatase
MTWDIKAGCMGKRELLKIVQHIIKHGLAEYESTAHLLSCFPDVPLTVPEYLEQRNTRQNKLWPTVPLLPGVKKLVLHLRAHNIPMAVATSSRRTTFELKTGHLGEVFDCFHGKVVCGDDKQLSMRGKPEPDIFLAAARELLGRDVGPADADATAIQLAERRKGLIFEDSIPGMQAGKRAGMSGAVQIALLALVSRLFGLPHTVVWVPDANLLDVEYSGEEKADQTLKSVEDFVPEQWGLPPYTQ